MKTDFNIDEVFKRLRIAVKPFPKAALFELFDDGYQTPFEQLLACIISIRTRDEVTVISAKRLFEKARTPESIISLSENEIDSLIYDCSFHRAKAGQFINIAGIVINEYEGQLPCDFDKLTSFKGVGPKCANLVLGIACGELRIGVDIHVHRITNRWGYVNTTTPEKTMISLENKLPIKYRIEINRLLVPFGKHICTGVMPKCSVCPILDICLQIGVTKHR
jgi:endonuclease-3